MANLWIELNCPEHGIERFKIKIIKKYNINSKIIKPKFRTKPKHELSCILIGKHVGYTEVRDYLVQYFRERGQIERVLSIKLQF